MEKLARIAPDHRESRILAAESALQRGEPDAAAAHLAPIGGPRTARLLALQARIAEARGDHDAARRLILEGVGAAGEPDWSDVDPTGPAFAYAEEDWARLVFIFGDEGRLIHPRHERFLPELIAAPALPLLPAPRVEEAGGAPDEATGSLFEEAAPARTGPVAPSPDDPGPYGDPLEDEDPEQLVRGYQ
jgi:HemY protein